MALTNFNLYEITLDQLRKDRKGSITIEEFEKMLINRSIWLFKDLLPVDDRDSVTTTALSPFLVTNNAVAISGSDPYQALYSAFTSSPAHIKSAYTIQSETKKWIDVVTPEELAMRYSNAITEPSASYPTATVSPTSLYLQGITSGSIYVTYYKNPAQPYLDYYLSSNGDYVYLSEDQSVYTLGSGEIARNGSTTTVTSQTAELEWNDNEKVLLVQYILSDLGIALKDQTVVQKSMAELQSSLLK